jgi:hypothetical protein
LDEFAPKLTMPNARENKPLAKGSQHFLWRMSVFALYLINIQRFEKVEKREWQF